MTNNRAVRFATIKAFYAMHKSGVLADNEQDSLEKAKTNVQFAKVFLTEVEVEKFFEANPEIDREDFLSFLNNTNGLKTKTKKASGSTSTLKINTIESAKEKDVSPEHYEKYVELTTSIHDSMVELRKILPKGWRATFSIIFVNPKTERIPAPGDPVPQVS